MTFRKLLIAFDGSPLSMHAIEYGGQLAKTLGAEAGVVFVVDPGQAVSNVGGIRPDELLAELRAEGQKRLDDARSRLGAQRRIADFLMVGNPANEIVHAADDWGADVIVLGVQRHGGLSRFVHRTCENVLTHARCPVLLVPASALVPE
ncbi:MAG TPA: universal stress protein [Dehalococcoidia bacterium]|jgi:nucleotide-binding universal stress UspA family protein